MAYRNQVGCRVRHADDELICRQAKIAPSAIFAWPANRLGRSSTHLRRELAVGLGKLLEHRSAKQM